jgi:hypothetical protein
MSEEGKEREEEEETEEESFEKILSLETAAEEEVSLSSEEVEVPKVSFSISSLETMLSIEELLLEALKNPDTVSQVVENIRKLRESFSLRQKKAVQKAKSVKKPKKKKTTKGKSKKVE